MSSLDLTPLTPPEGEGPAAAALTPPAGPDARPAPRPAAPPGGQTEPAGAGRLDIPVAPQVQEALRANAGGFVQQVLALDPHSPDLDARVRDIGTMADREVAESAALSRRMLDRQARSTSAERTQGGPERAAADQLVQLRRVVEELDPAQLDRPTRKLLGVLPMGDRVRDYFERYLASQDRITMMILALRTQQDELRKDNAAIAGERANLWRFMGQLQEYVVLCGAIDDQLTAALAGLDATDPGRAAVLRDRVLHAVRQKRQDLLTHLAVCVQGYLALDLVRSNNELLVGGIDRAATTTMAALRTAVVVSDALQGQRLVLDRVAGADRASAGMLDGSAAQVRQAASGEAPEAAVGRLKEAFGEVYAALDDTVAAQQRGERDIARHG
ncbi:toxic anion resistance protein [Arsenicicoccus dermatophilus]|uniref:toxic anion resistance protein n=1 Tax=Arsenicicoccus dermatophilus TaxID=1076331 RepID=UPI001F4CB0F5|nr:toxic anion resistance protein [Arsenicicoccus dermatophilus]MCH8611723.1 toxic anion resistance protein [Arsenicicoccus dermatophilus]